MQTPEFLIVFSETTPELLFAFQQEDQIVVGQAIYLSIWVDHLRSSKQQRITFNLNLAMGISRKATA